MFHRRCHYFLIFASLLLVGCGSRGASGVSSAIGAEKGRRKAPEFSLKDADGRQVKLSDYKGRVVLLNFWATWCGPCRIEIPWFIEFEQKYKDQGLSVVGIAMDEDGWDVIKPYIERSKVNYRILLGDEIVSELYGGIEALPTTFVIDREGRVASEHPGLISKKVYEDEIQQLLPVGNKSAERRVPPALPALLLRAE